MVLLIGMSCMAGCTGPSSAPVATPAPVPAAAVTGTPAPAGTTATVTPVYSWTTETPYAGHPYTKTYSFHGTGDKTTPYKGAQAFQEAMKQAGNRCELVVTEGAVHGYLMRDRAQYEQAIRQTETFLASLGYLPREAKQAP